MISSTAVLRKLIASADFPLDEASAEDEMPPIKLPMGAKITIGLGVLTFGVGLALVFMGLTRLTIGGYSTRWALALATGVFLVAAIFVVLKSLLNGARALKDMSTFLTPALAKTLEDLEYEFTKLHEYKANPKVQTMIDWTEPAAAGHLAELMQLQAVSTPEELDQSDVARKLERLAADMRVFRLAL